MDLNATIIHTISCVLIAGIGGIFLTQIFWLSRHLRELWTRRGKLKFPSNFQDRDLSATAMRQREKVLKRISEDNDK